jgi:hypothetical protein
MTMNREELAKRIYDLGQEIKGLTDEKEELREDLAKRMEVGDIVRFLTPEGLYRAIKCRPLSTVWKSPEDILGIVGEDTFVMSVKIVPESLRGLVSDEILEMCIFAEKVPGEPVLKILKGGG